MNICSARLRPDLKDHTIPTSDDTYISIDPEEIFPAQIPERIEDQEFNCRIKLNGHIYRVMSIDLEFI